MTILAVDDEKYALKGLVDSLREASSDATILSTEDPDEALKIAGELSIDLLVTDLFMGGMDGDELAIKIHEQHPKTEILFETGESKNVLLERGIQMERVLRKPVFVEDIVQMVEELHSLPPFEIRGIEPEAEITSEVPSQEPEEIRESWFQHIKKKLRNM